MFKHLAQNKGLHKTRSMPFIQDTNKVSAIPWSPKSN